MLLEDYLDYLPDDLDDDNCRLFVLDRQQTRLLDSVGILRLSRVRGVESLCCYIAISQNNGSIK